MNNMTGITSGAGTAYPPGEDEFIPSFSGVRVAQSLDLYATVCLLSFDLWIQFTTLVFPNFSFFFCQKQMTESFEECVLWRI